MRSRAFHYILTIIGLVLIFAGVQILILNPRFLNPPETELPLSTGAEPYTPNPATPAQIQEAAIHEIIPVDQTDFSITFNYKDDRITVTLKNEPYEDAYQNFKTWLFTNRYNDIPDNRFEFILQ